jgi:hypothetical protein
MVPGLDALLDIFPCMGLIPLHKVGAKVSSDGLVAQGTPPKSVVYRDNKLNNFQQVACLGRCFRPWGDDQGTE